ncbi:methyltransferase [Pseudomonas plecoglossicida]|uniref:methyltransferase n=1 Tax=Pseudomonas plecoglossicida TaxID=70775 RepID=UPI00159F50E3|nr:methyltransferase [Pseudomonas plecoglossicida]QLB54035.1 class I SAM-dependent methyltransferase [Pseudomonas plecoglossicida]
MDPRSEVLLRQADLFQGPLLLAGAPADGLLGQLPKAHGWTWHAGDQAMLDSRFAGRSHYGVEAPTVAFDAAVLFLPKSRELAAYLLNALASRLGGRELYLVGEKRGGIEGAAKQLQAFGKPRKLDSARHCQLWQVTVEHAPEAKPLESLAERFQLDLEDGPLQVVSLPGVFSHGRLDRGTALLLKPWTLAANQLEGQVVSGDGIDAAPRELSLILSNPPFHTGVHTNYQASENLLKKSGDHLRKAGEMRLVANSFLRYQPLIEGALGNCQTCAEADGFRIYRATRG